MKRFLFSLIAFVSLGLGAAVPQLPESAVALDGRPDEAVWGRAAVWRGMKRLGDRTKAGADGEIRLFASGGFLYGAMTVFEPDPSKLKMTVKPGEVKRYPQIHENDDVINLFLAEGNRYFSQIAFNPAGVRLFYGARPTMLLYEDWRQDRLREEWTPEIEHGVHVYPDRWTVEFRLKLSDFENFRSNRWRFNMCRERRAGENELSTLFPMSGARFNDSRQYGTLRIDGVTDSGEPDEKDDNSLAPADAARWSVLSGVLRNRDGALEISGGTKAVSAESLMVFPGSTLRLSGEFRASGPKVPALFFGLQSLDARSREILPQNILAVPHSDTVLVADTAPGEAELMVKDASAWKTGPGYFVAFHSAPDYADLPNTLLSYTAGVKQVERDGTRWRVTLNGPHRFSGRAGTPVRLHTTGASYLYLDGKALPLTPSWQRFQVNISGFARPGQPAENRLWPGTAAVRLLIWMPGKQSADGVLFRNVKLEALR